MYDTDRSPSDFERISYYREQYRKLGLFIFEPFEEYMKDKEQTDEQNEH